MLAECSTAVVSTCRFSGWVTRALWIAELLLSVPQLVKMISRGSALISAATRARAWSRCSPTWRPNSVGAGRIAPILPQEGKHRLHHLGRDPRGGVVVEIIDGRLTHRTSVSGQQSSRLKADCQREAEAAAELGLPGVLTKQFGGVKVR